MPASCSASACRHAIAAPITSRPPSLNRRSAFQASTSGSSSVVLPAPRDAREHRQGTAFGKSVDRRPLLMREGETTAGNRRAGRFDGQSRCFVADSEFCKLAEPFLDADLGRVRSPAPSRRYGRRSGQHARPSTGCRVPSISSTILVMSLGPPWAPSPISPRAAYMPSLS